MDWDLTKEAVSVGVLLVPVYAVVRESVRNIQSVNSTTQEYTSVFLSGALFHILCEATGINEWYLTNGRASKIKNGNKHVRRTRSCGDSRVCSLAFEESYT
jgi:hypothetical protein